MPHSTPARPWIKYYGSIPESLSYPQVSMYTAVRQSAEKFAGSTAYDFFGRTATYADLIREIDRCADGLHGIGLRRGQRVTIAMPTSPQGIICFYALNKLGAVASMIHPLSTQEEIAFYVTVSKSRFVLTLDAFYAKFKAVAGKTALEKIILARIADYLPFVKKIGFALTKGRKIAKVPPDADVIWWEQLMAGAPASASAVDMGPDELAVILYSGGTTGKPKGIMLSNANFISEGLMVASWGGLSKGHTILAILPIFHGFGLGVCVNAALMSGAQGILVPAFTSAQVARLIRSKKPSFLIGVPTLYEALNKDPQFQKADLSCLKACFCGADSLPRIVKEAFEKIVERQGGSVKLLEGYGLTEAVTAIMATPMHEYREGSIGVPFPGMDAKIVRPDTCECADCGEEGEICVCGPAVMLGYLDQPEETAKVLKKHDDGRTWLHTGDIGTMDQDGFFYFKLRQKRMIKSSGMNVYPTQVEEVLYRHPLVAEACVIGVPDREQVERVKAFVVLKDPLKADAGMQQELIAHCRKALIKWSCPREIEFRPSLPKTLVGKIAYKHLENEEIERLQAQGKYCGKDQGVVHDTEHRC